MADKVSITILVFSCLNIFIWLCIITAAIILIPKLIDQVDDKTDKNSSNERQDLSSTNIS